ncbi:MAG TPA: gamma-glutamyltransferase [Pseudonocardiaceae bacterium]|nr:gamma-glutamyltransferase [Pseudonocardiaceae bacterium]
MRKRTKILAVLPIAAALAASLLVTTDSAASPAALTWQPLAVGYGGAVVSDTLQSTQAGLDVLKHGGTAADAAVAVASTLGVTDPFVAGIGGGGYLVYYDARTHRITTIDGRETTPAGADQNLFIDPATGKPFAFPTAVTSGLSVGVPGTLMTWQRALNQWGHFSLAQDLRPAEQVARNGFPVTAHYREQDRENAFRFTQFSSSNALYLQNGQLPDVGSMISNPDLADTYQQIGRQGVGALYGGSIGADVVNAVHNLPLAPGATLVPRPGYMQLSDLAGYTAPDKAPTHVNYRGYDVYGMGPSSSGGMTGGESLNILSNFNLGAEPRTEALHDYLEATRLAFADRNRYIGDASYVNVPEQQLLSKQYGADRSCLINQDKAATSPVAPGDPYNPTCGTATSSTAAQPTDGAATNHFVVTDKWGDIVSYTNTIEEIAGSAIVVPGRGFLLNNELTDFDFTPLQAGVPDPNLPAAGKRPRSSMSPTIVLHNGKPFMAIGSPGGATIITTVLQILINRIDFGMSLPDAIAAPRASQRNGAQTQAEPDFLTEPTTQGLEQLGQSFYVNSTSPLNPSIQIPPTIGIAAGLEFLGNGKVLAAGEPVRAGGTSAGVVRPAH